MTQPSLLTRTQAGDPYAAVPDLATCSYFEYKRGMGTAVRITRMAPRGISLPDPRFTGQPHWPTARALFPGPDYFRKGLSSAEFADRYRADLDLRDMVQARLIVRDLAQLDVEDGRLVLLCFENRHQLAKDPLCCHRRVFAAWWTERTGRDVPELG